MPFSLRLSTAAPAAAAADALCVMRSLPRPNLLHADCFAGCKTRRHCVKSSGWALSRYLTRKSCKLERRTMKLLCALLAALRRCTRYQCECNRRACVMWPRLGRVRFNFACCLTNVSFKYIVYVMSISLYILINYYYTVVKQGCVLISNILGYDLLVYKYTSN